MKQTKEQILSSPANNSSRGIQVLHSYSKTYATNQPSLLRKKTSYKIAAERQFCVATFAPTEGVEVFTWVCCFKQSVFGLRKKGCLKKRSVS